MKTQNILLSIAGIFLAINLLFKDKNKGDLGLIDISFLNKK